MRRKRAKTRQLWVIKVGSRTLSVGGPRLVRKWMLQVAALRKNHDVDVVWVTSGAIATALDRLARPKGKIDFLEKQALSTVGQPLVMNLYISALAKVGLPAAQAILTYHDMCVATNRRSVVNAFALLRQWGVVPIVNQNDLAIRPKKKFKDNDWLAAFLASMLGADRLIYCTDVEGLYDKDPKTNAGAQVIPRLRGISPAVMAMAGSQAGSAVSDGGMHSKLSAAKLAGAKSIETWLVRGDAKDVLLQIARNQVVGTRIQPR